MEEYVAFASTLPLFPFTTVMPRLAAVYAASPHAYEELLARCSIPSAHVQQAFFTNPPICQGITQYQGETAEHIGIRPAFVKENLYRLTGVRSGEECRECILTGSCGEENRTILLVLSGSTAFGNERMERLATTIMMHVSHEELSDERVRAYRELLLTHANELSFFPEGTVCKGGLLPLD